MILNLVSHSPTHIFTVITPQTCKLLVQYFRLQSCYPNNIHNKHYCSLSLNQQVIFSSVSLQTAQVTLQGILYITTGCYVFVHNYLFIEVSCSLRDTLAKQPTDKFCMVVKDLITVLVLLFRGHGREANRLSGFVHLLLEQPRQELFNIVFTIENCFCLCQKWQVWVWHSCLLTEQQVDLHKNTHFASQALQSPNFNATVVYMHPQHRHTHTLTNVLSPVRSSIHQKLNQL